MLSWIDASTCSLRRPWLIEVSAHSSLKGYVLATSGWSRGAVETTYRVMEPLAIATRDWRTRAMRQVNPMLKNLTPVKDGNSTQVSQRCLLLDFQEYILFPEARSLVKVVRRIYQFFFWVSMIVFHRFDPLKEVNIDIDSMGGETKKTGSITRVAAETTDSSSAETDEKRAATTTNSTRERNTTVPKSRPSGTTENRDAPTPACWRHKDCLDE